jgi:hypothetical protein
MKTEKHSTLKIHTDGSFEIFITFTDGTTRKHIENSPEPMDLAARIEEIAKVIRFEAELAINLDDE